MKRQSRHQRHPRQRRLQGHPGAAAGPARGRPGPRHRPRHQPQGAGAALARPTPLPRGPRLLGDQFRRPRSTGCAPTAPNAIPGFMTQLTLTGGFANKTLFEQAGVAAPRRRARPGTTGSRPRPRSPTSQQLPAAFAIDRSGHRISGPNISYGANYIGAGRHAGAGRRGRPRPSSSKLVGWTEDGTMLKEIWVSAAGTTYRAARRRLHQRPGRLLLFRQLAGRRTSRPRSATTSTGWRPARPADRPPAPACRAAPALVAIKYTKNPEEVAKVMEYLGSEPVVKEFTERTLFLPAHKGVIAKRRPELQDRRPATSRPRSTTFVAASQRRRARRRAAAGWKWAERLLRRARHPHQPGDGRRADARRRLHPHRRGHRRQGRRRPSSSGARCRRSAAARRLGRRHRHGAGRLARARSSTRRCARCQRLAGLSAAWPPSSCCRTW